ncbi:MAG: helix-turn-helix domain-containing protein [Candidatus Micrarchaeota archaeon]|nr:helix-turn-helix domain-containing protein [Candidatus Micrarchaeota archaeon]MBU1681196.1 helix-turn-helix domain-containing protein [Candidatus Micrarchaeota archaeon]
MRLFNDDGKSLGCLSIDSNTISALSRDRLEILKMICNEPSYPAELARKLKMPLQTIYYHIKILEKANLLEFVDYEERNGGIAKRYRSRAESLAIVINKTKWKESSITTKPVPKIIQPFIKDGFFDASIVIGSPEPHGKYRARGSEYGMLELAMYLGQHATFDFPLYSLDVRMNKELREKNLIVAGGPKVNTFVHDINDKLPIKFDEKNFIVKSEITGKKYEENVGVIELIKNPHNKNKKVLLIGGLNSHGTRAAVIALVKEKIDIKDEKMNHVVAGYDEDGDGVVDSIEILE